jgi:hypothetical protein
VVADMEAAWGLIGWASEWVVVVAMGTSSSAVAEVVMTMAEVAVAVAVAVVVVVMARGFCSSTNQRAPWRRRFIAMVRMKACGR